MRLLSLYRSELALAFVLVIASNVFVLAFRNMARWEVDMTGTAKLAPAQLERCIDGSGRALNDACQMDCCWYTSIIRSGYDREPVFGGGNRANWNFFPLFPLTAVPWYRTFSRESTHAAVVASRFMLYFAIVAFMFMVRSDSDGIGDLALAGSLVAFNPAIIYAHAGYAEPLYFTLAAIGLALLDRQRWIGAGLAGALLSATRMVGVVFGVVYAIAALRTGAVGHAIKQRRLAVLIGALLCPAGLSLFALYLYNHTGDALASVHIYVGWRISSGNPLTVMLDALREGEWARFWACIAVAGWALSVWLFVQKQYEKAVFLALTILVPTTAEVAGMQRFVWWQPPTLYAAFLLLKRHPRWRTPYFIFTGGMAAVMTLIWFLGGRSIV
jgi:hypothetical protein